MSLVDVIACCRLLLRTQTHTELPYYQRHAHCHSTMSLEPCVICAQNTPNLFSIREHYRQVHPYTCGICREVFESKSLKSFHIINVHEPTQIFRYNIQSEDGLIWHKGRGQVNGDLSYISRHIDRLVERECEVADCHACLGLDGALEKAAVYLGKKLEETSRPGVLMFGFSADFSKTSRRVKFMALSTNLTWRSPRRPSTRSTEFVGGDRIVFIRNCISIDPSREILAVVQVRLVSVS